MRSARREFLRALAAGGATLVTDPLSRESAAAEAQGAAGTRPTPDFKKIKGLAFDAYGTLFDVHSVIALGEQLFPGQGTALSNTWRLKQLQYTWQRSLMGRYADFWKVTEDGLVFATKSLKLDLDPSKRKQLMDAVWQYTYPYLGEYDATTTSSRTSRGRGSRRPTA